MIRKGIAAALCVAVQAMVVELPSLHAHLDDHATAHHRSRIIHAHFDDHHSAAPDDGVAVEAEDHDAATPVAAVAALASGVAIGLAPAVDAVDVPTPPTHRVKGAFEISHGHDPPGIATLPSRAPPAFLS